jgi:RNA polymerase sigma-70 factor (sigma-E family)
MTQESGATVSNLWPGTSSGEGEARDVRVDVARTRDAEFTAFVRECGPYLHRTAYLLCGDPHRAEELVQSTFERVYRTWAKVRPGTQKAYARQILVNLRIDGWRHGRRESFPGDDKIPLAATSDHAGRVMLRDELVRGLAQLPASQRRVVVLRHLLDLPEAEVARELGISVGTVKAANSRGLARLRDLLRAGAEAIEPVDFDEQTVLDRSRAALRRRRVGQAVGAACVVLLLALGVVTRGPVSLPGVGPVVLPGGQLFAPLFDDGRADRIGPDPTSISSEPTSSDPDPTSEGNTPVACPEEVPDPTPTRPAEPGEDLGVLHDPVVVDATDARTLTCYDVDIEAITRGSTREDYDLPYAGGLSDTGAIWDGVVQPGPDDGRPEEAYLRAGGYRGDEPKAFIPTLTIDDEPMWPGEVAARGARAMWSEYLATPAINYLRTVEEGGEARTLAMVEEGVSELAVTQDHALWMAGPYDDKTLFTTPLDDPGTPTELANNVRAVGADGDEVVAAVSGAESGETSTTSIRLFDNLAGGDFTGTTLFEIEHDSPGLVTEVAISDEVVAWVVMSVTVGPDDVRHIGPDDGSTLYVVDRAGGRDSIVRFADDFNDGSIEDLSASHGLISWSRIDSVSSRTSPLAHSSYLYRATPSASGYDGPDLARFPGESVTANLAGNRIAWNEDRGRREWLVEGTVAPTLRRD